MYLLTEKLFKIQIYEIRHFLPCFSHTNEMCLYVDDHYLLIGHIFLTHAVVIEMMVMENKSSLIDR